jgi:hypothetical protein
MYKCFNFPFLHSEFPMPHSPPFRSLDICRLVVARRLKQLDVARSFGVDPSRISQVVRRVRDWVNDSLGDWLFPGRDDLRFYVALELANIRVTETPDDPYPVTLSSPSCTYTRHFPTSPSQPHQPDAQARDTSALLSPRDPASHHDAPPSQNTHAHPNMSPQPINSPLASNCEPFAATPDATTESIPPHIRQMGLHIAQLLMLWKKHHKLTAAIKPIRSSSQHASC